MSKIQLYSVSLVTLWVYDYFLTVGDEVAKSTDDNNTEGN